MFSSLKYYSSHVWSRMCSSGTSKMCAYGWRDKEYLLLTGSNHSFPSLWYTIASSAAQQILRV